jgi:hypothetical protein
VSLRREQIELARVQERATGAYLALGGSTDRGTSVASELLVAIASDFVGDKATRQAMGAVVKHKMRAVQSVLDAGGALDSDDEAELRDTSMLQFDEIEAFGAGLSEHGPDADAAADDEDEPAMDASRAAALLR